MLPVFERLDRVLGRIERMMSASMLLIMTGLIFTNIMLRFFTGRTLSWAEDLSIFCMITMTFFAAAYGTRTNQHITMSAIPVSTTLRASMPAAVPTKFNTGNVNAWFLPKVM